MKVINQSYEILFPATKLNFRDEAILIEIAGRTAYKSEDKIDSGSFDPFIRGIVKRDHGAVIEFGSMMVKFVTDRGVSHELVRMRLCSFLQESTRYCNYGQDKFGNEITVIRPSKWNTWDTVIQDNWSGAMINAERDYLFAIDSGHISPQEARAILPNSLKTEICVKTNFREWRHIFKLRAISRAAHPDMRALMIPLYNEVREALPCVFDMGDVE
jgi:thymidylate synthase (FAD)